MSLELVPIKSKDELIDGQEIWYNSVDSGRGLVKGIYIQNAREVAISLDRLVETVDRLLGDGAVYAWWTRIFTEGPVVGHNFGFMPSDKILVENKKKEYRIDQEPMEEEEVL
ncbi:hypothetical protein SmphiM6_91 [Sinorhizobium phage phiM6]|nr:hypothetical protein SmphiM6_91 [Sinorhizobium phage phiM6]